MAYRVAVIQNENELLRYSYADARHLLTQSRYAWSYFTAENIALLERSLSTFDALIISTNACNDPTITAWLTNQQARLHEFLHRDRRGLFVLFQMALADERGGGKAYPFLPYDLAVSGRKRFIAGEQASSGILRLANPSASHHPVLVNPSVIDLTTLQSACLNNYNVPGLYWGYVDEYPKDAYEPLIIDSNYPERCLLIASRTFEGPRVVVSPLIVDWQRHDSLWENCVRFVVEGADPIAILRKRGRSAFEVDYLEQSFLERKVSYRTYLVNDLGSWNDSYGLHPAIVLDPDWDLADASAFLKRVTTVSGRRPVNMHFFFREVGGQLVACTLPAQDDYAPVIDSALTWLQAQWRDGDLWSKSFWATYEVLRLFVQAGADIGPYRDSYINAIETHIQPNGSYDDVFGATLATLQVFRWYSVTGHLWDNTLNWVLCQFPSQNLYNQATAVEILPRVAPGALEQNTTSSVIERICQSAGRWDPGLETLRYMRTLVVAGRFDQAQAEVGRLQPAAVGSDQWLTIFGAAETVEILVYIYEHASYQSDDTQRLLFSGVEYLLDHYDKATGTWRNHITVTAKAAVALDSFRKRISPAMNEILRLVTGERSAQILTVSHGVLRGRNRELLNSLKQQQKLVRDSVGIQNFTVASSVALYVLSLALLLTVVAALDSFDDLVTWAKSWQQFAYPILLVLLALPVLAVSRMLARFGREPRWLRFMREHLPWLHPILGSRDGDAPTP